MTYFCPRCENGRLEMNCPDCEGERMKKSPTLFGKPVIFTPELNGGGQWYLKELTDDDVRVTVNPKVTP